MKVIMRLILIIFTFGIVVHGGRSSDGDNDKKMYFGMYGSNLSGTEMFTNLLLGANVEEAIAKKRENNIQSLLLVQWYFFNFTSHRLRDDWKEQWDGISSIARDLLSNETIIGFNLGTSLSYSHTHSFTHFLNTQVMSLSGVVCLQML